MSEKRHLRPEDIERLNKVIVDRLDMDRSVFVGVIESLTKERGASDHILTIVEQLLLDHGTTFIGEVCGIIRLLRLIHPLIYGSEDNFMEVD